MTTVSLPTGLRAGTATIPAPRRSAEEAVMARMPTDRPEPAAGPRPLSERDVELLRHLAVGRSTAQIAAALSITSNTARTRIRRIQRKLAVAGRAQVVRVAEDRELI